jgi:hypothetical protein
MNRHPVLEQFAKNPWMGIGGSFRRIRIRYFSPPWFDGKTFPPKPGQ